jgi:imidazolonepropionase-like amidohydrolase
MRPTIWALLLGLGAACLYAGSPPAIAIQNARIVTVSGPVLERGTVVLRDGLIEAVGENVTIPSDARIVDGQKLTVYPGLIDALSGIGLPEAPSAPAAPTAARRAAPSAAPVAQGPEDRPFTNSWVRAADLIDPGDRRIEDARSAGFTSVATFPSGGIFAGQGAMVNLSGAGKRARMIVAAPLGQYVAMDRRASAGDFPSSLLGTIAYVRQVFLDAGNYRLEKAAYDRHAAGARRPDYDRALEGVQESPRLLLPAGRAVEIERMIRFAADLKTPAVIYGGHEAFRDAGAVAKGGVPILVSLKWPERERESDPSDPVSLRTLELWDRAPSTPAALAKAGAPFAFYTGGIPVRDIPKAVKKAIDAGLAPAAAVRALTLSVAEIYGLAGCLGSVEKGKIANLAVTEGQLFETGTKVKFIFVDGVKYEPIPPAETAPAQRGGDR